MGIPETEKVSGRAAVLVIDNAKGSSFFGMSAEAMDNLGEDLFESMFVDHYSHVFVVKAPMSRNNEKEVLINLDEATKRFGTVDMIVLTHNNTDNGSGLVGVPANRYFNKLSPEQRNHLRLLLNIGCEEGGQRIANMAYKIGFKTYVGFPERGPNGIGAYWLLEKWLSGMSLKSAATEVQKKIDRWADIIWPAIYAYAFRESGEFYFERYLDPSCQPYLLSPDEKKPGLCASPKAFANRLTQKTRNAVPTILGEDVPFDSNDSIIQSTK
ncbi:MAG: hypothetical protein Q7T03_07955 [Deltaproteobacteria bacterium]|nr:hypothetical protein [Deltaproteobacteria bacterium]